MHASNFTASRSLHQRLVYRQYSQNIILFRIVTLSSLAFLPILIIFFVFYKFPIAIVINSSDMLLDIKKI